MNNADQVSKDKKPSKLKKIGQVLLLIFFVFIIITALGAMFSSDGTTTTPAPEQPEALTDVEVYVEAQAIVEKALKSPSTAEFPSTSNAQIQRIGTDTFKVDSYVDSQNGFGAMIRSEWSVLFKVADGMVEVYALVIDGETVYKKEGVDASQ